MIFLLNKERRKKFNYTLQHKKEFFKMALETKELALIYRALLHDSDKLFLLAFSSVNYDIIKMVHMKRKHHSYRNLSDLTIKEKILDWESSSRSKPDKPETARMFLESSAKKQLPIADYFRFLQILDEMGY